MTETNGHALTLDDLWPQAAEHLAPALAWTRGSHTIEHVREMVDDGRAQLWPMDDGAIVSEIVKTPTGQCVCRLWLAGGKLGALLQAERVVSEWAAEQGCDCMEIVGRPGWQRSLPEYERVAIVLRRELPKPEGVQGHG